MNIAILAIAVIALAGIPSAFACTEGNVQHWTVYNVFSELEIQHDSQPSLTDNIILPIPTMGSELIGNSNFQVKAADRLNQMGYYVVDPIPRAVTENDIDFEDVFDGVRGYSTICINGVQQMIGGMLIQPDAMTLALAYTIANSVWMAPLAVGIAAGVYLTKSKLKK